MSDTIVKSAGCVVCRLTPSGRFEVLVLLVGKSKQEPGYWGFPKGKQEIGENIEAAAIREVVEETSIQVELLALAGITRYAFTNPEGKNRQKIVRLYLAYPIGQDLAGGDDGDREAEWLPSDQACQRLTYDADREVLSRALRLVEQNPLYQQLIAGAANGS